MNGTGFPDWGTPYVFGLSFLLVGLVLLTLGLVQRWGEVVPRWIPRVGGKPVPPMLAVVPAATGDFALTMLWAAVFSNIDQIWGYFGLDGPERVFRLACYLPLLLVVVTHDRAVTERAPARLHLVEGRLAPP